MRNFYSANRLRVGTCDHKLNGTKAKKPFSGPVLYALSCGVTHFVASVSSTTC